MTGTKIDNEIRKNCGNQGTAGPRVERSGEPSQVLRAGVLTLIRESVSLPSLVHHIRLMPYCDDCCLNGPEAAPSEGSQKHIERRLASGTEAYLSLMIRDRKRKEMEKDSPAPGQSCLPC